jgi:membrane associated rhomboid family serine protease
MGHKKFLIVFFASGILANIISMPFYNLSLGASGAIFGVIGALIIVRPTLSVFAFGMPMPMFLAGILWGIGDLLGAVSFLSGNPINNTGNIAHLSGMAIGLILGLLFKKPQLKNNHHNIQLDEDSIRRWEDINLR